MSHNVIRFMKPRSRPKGGAGVLGLPQQRLLGQWAAQLRFQGLYRSAAARKTVRLHSVLGNATRQAIADVIPETSAEPCRVRSPPRGYW